MSWILFPRVDGVMVDGDEKQSKLSNIWILRMIQKGAALWLGWWDTVAVLEVESDEPYLVGYTDTFGETRLRTVPVTTHRFAAALGHEPCEFFAIKNLKDASPLRLKVVDRRPRKNPGDGVTVI